MIEIVETATLADNARRAAFHRALAKLYDAGPDAAIDGHLFVLALAAASGLRDVLVLATDALDNFCRRIGEAEPENPLR